MFVDLAVGIVTGIFSGGYTGFVLARYTKFRDLRDEALRIVRGIQYVTSDNDPFTNITGYDPLRMALIGSDLFSAKHKKFGLIITDINKDLSDIVFKAHRSGVPIGKISKADSHAQERIRKATPSFLSLLSLKPRI
jgi:hypothetical protein